MVLVRFERAYFDPEAGKHRKQGEYARVSAEQAAILIKEGAARLIDVNEKPEGEEKDA